MDISISAKELAVEIKDFQDSGWIHEFFFFLEKPKIEWRGNFDPFIWFSEPEPAACNIALSESANVFFSHI